MLVHRAPMKLVLEVGRQNLAAALSYVPRASYFSQVADLMDLLPIGYLSWRERPSSLWRRVKRFLKALWLLLPCLLVGHRYTRRAWIHTSTRKIGEFHCGCTRCTLFWTEDPNFVVTQRPRFRGLRL